MAEPFPFLTSPEWKDADYSRRFSILREYVRSRRTPWTNADVLALVAVTLEVAAYASFVQSTVIALRLRTEKDKMR